MGGSHIVVGHHLLLGQTQLVTEPVQARIRSAPSSLGILLIPLEVADPGLELVDLRSSERHLPKEMVVVISHNVSLTGGAIQPSGQVADLDRLISQQESQVLRPRGRTVLPPLDLHSLVMDLGSQGLKLGSVQRRSMSWAS
ncbi:hypothetical protein GN958_ATG02782 [Phytophthora infestans]|uniref:Uncharacterized protein n=1 Tax=Phytophthora infestans TaxID=4787 RepID=A0A8S9V5A1_PHYIN|nr:hypothetical protein GN958_ATG02782 [Phytophthora infestans]